MTTNTIDDELLDQIKLIHSSKDVIGDFIEIGAAQPLTNLLFRVSGASGTIRSAKSPYDCDVQKRKYGHSLLKWDPIMKKRQNKPLWTRSVSARFVLSVIARQFSKNNKCGPYYDGDYGEIDPYSIWASSFQIAEDACSHGWIAYYSAIDEVVHLVHITFPPGTKRNDCIDQLREISVKLMILFNHLDTSDNVEYPDFIDYYNTSKIGDVDDDFDRLHHNILHFNVNDVDLDVLVQTKESYYVINQNNDWERIQDTFRQNEPIVIFKGSFNPIHDGHWEMVDHVLGIYPDSPLGLMISTNNFEKTKRDSFNTENLRNRIDKINSDMQDKNYDKVRTILTYKGMFRDSIEDMRKIFPENELIFVLGMDTFVRIEPELFAQESNVKFIVFDRDNELSKLDKTPEQISTCLFINYNNPLRSTDLRLANIKN